MIRQNTWIWFQPISFQIIWLTTILGGNQYVAFAIGLLCVHYLFSPQRKKDLLITPLAIVGFCIDLILTNLGMFQFSEWPFWLLVLWIAFVLNFGHSLKFLRNLNTYALVLLGALGGCYAYWASWKLNAVAWPNDMIVTGSVIACLWALILPSLVKLEYLLSRYLSNHVDSTTR